MELILVRGLPGSGKSTIARKFVGVHLEADMYFMQDGEYKFDVNKLRQAHEWCQEQTRNWLKPDARVVVSNTFTTMKELRPYFEIAREFGIVPNVIVAQGNFKNEHNVPEETLTKMKARFTYDISELYDKFLNVTAGAEQMAGDGGYELSTHEKYEAFAKKRNGVE